MKMIIKLMLVSVVASTFSALAQDPIDEQAIYAELRAQMERACPMVWEDLEATMDTESLNSDVWSGNQADKDEFVALLQEVMTSSTAQDIAAMSDDVATVATECASHRVALLDALISKTPRDVLLAMDAVNRGLNKSIEYLDGGWSVGDVRMTGRLEPQDGWVFLTGQTVGSAGSTADLAGDDYNELFELAKNWAPNAGTEEWSANHIVKLPDMRGRVLVGLDNMGGTPANVLTDGTEYNKVGGTFGEHRRTMTVNHLPSHNHTMNNAGVHKHTVGNDTHSHSIQVVTYDADSGATRYLSSQTDHGGPNVGVTSSISADTHNHSMTNSTSHKHTINNTGGSDPISSVQPSLALNIEMKY